ncbi:glucuronate isomerase [uncultured Deefgea sp.]|uniref:glucuronate isomerase n=1 Tax=uncultured Deefgea sp. TaxID=1304914 RepID=UPI0026055E8E|nr:glucuronate isomerase [uncultured Deefgea sp.]
MMKSFMDQDFLLDTGVAQQLYHEIAADLPIIDYHSHLPPDEIANRKSWRNMTELWLGGDHYKWRLMRSAGIDESLITGNASDEAKFNAFCSVLPQAIGNPIYHWSHLELRRIFGIDTLINAKNAPQLWTDINQKLAQMDSWSMLKQANVEIACTTDDPADDLLDHQRIANSSLTTRVLPAFRPDKAMRINDAGFIDYLAKLSQCSGVEIHSFKQLITALAQRIEFFHLQGARISDHAVDLALPHQIISDAELEVIFQQRLAGQLLSPAAQSQYLFAILAQLAPHYAAQQWTMCLHIGAQRNNNQRQLIRLGADTGYDAISGMDVSLGLAHLLDTLDAQQCLPKTMLFCLNPNLNEVLSTLMGCYQDGSMAGKVQFGPAWWFNDHKEGNLQQFITLANHGVFGAFVGMVTDSRSFASYPRHDYFRRLLCRQVGAWVESGEYPHDEEALSQIIRGVCYDNAKKYFSL